MRFGQAHGSGPATFYNRFEKGFFLPVFTVVLDNSGWGAVKAATLRVYPEGEAKAEGEFGATLSPHMNFAKVAEASGAYGELVSDPAEVESAIARCLDAVRTGRSALLHAKVTRI